MNEVEKEDRYKYYDDLYIFEFLTLSKVLLVEYDCLQHVPSDIDVNLPYLPQDSYNLQSNLNYISKWTDNNLMCLNEGKCNYIVYSRMKSKFNTRLSINEMPIERLSETKVLGVWLDGNLFCEKNTKNICIHAYTRIPVLSKLKYAGIGRDELLTVYKLFIRCIPEYCSVVFHKALSIE